VTEEVKPVSYNFLLAWGCPKAATQICPPASTPGQFSTPTDVAVDPSGKYAYVVDANNNRVQKFDTLGNFLSQWGSKEPGSLNGPLGIALDSSSNSVYVVDAGNNRVQKFDTLGNYFASFGSTGSGPGQFNDPQFIAADSSGNVYVTDGGNFRVEKFDSSGNFIALWGSRGAGKGQFQNPEGVAVDPSGKYVYVADSGNYRIQKFDSSGNYIAQWGSVGSGNGQFGSGSGSGFYGFGPGNLAVDSSGNVYVTDTGNYRVQKFDGSGNYVTQFGAYGPGPGQFEGLGGVAVDSSGNLYVVDEADNRVEKFNTPGGTTGTLCVIVATSVGSAVAAANVQWLRAYRDTRFKAVPWGARLIWKAENLYYRVSPRMVGVVERNPRLKKAIRWTFVLLVLEILSSFALIDDRPTPKRT
jgi:tripartite motif-containing protein 71